MVAENSRVCRDLRQLRADFLDVGDEAHVEHAVGFVDDQQVAAVEHDLAAAEQVHQPARRGDQHVDALFERLHLVAHLHAADQQRHRERVIFAVFLEILGDLHRQLAGRLEDQRARHPRAAAALVQDVDHRQHEAGGLAGAGLGDADEVLAHQHRRDRRALDRGRLVIAAVVDGAEQFVGKAEIGKSHSKSGRKRWPRASLGRAANALGGLCGGTCACQGMWGSTNQPFSGGTWEPAAGSARSCSFRPMREWMASRPAQTPLIVGLEVETAVEIERRAIVLELGADAGAIVEHEVDVLRPRQQGPADGAGRDAVRALASRPIRCCGTGAAAGPGRAGSLRPGRPGASPTVRLPRAARRQAEQQRHKLQKALAESLKRRPHRAAGFAAKR